MVTALTAELPLVLSAMLDRTYYLRIILISNGVLILRFITLPFGAKSHAPQAATSALRQFTFPPHVHGLRTPDNADKCMTQRRYIVLSLVSGKARCVELIAKLPLAYRPSFTWPRYSLYATAVVSCGAAV